MSSVTSPELDDDVRQRLAANRDTGLSLRAIAEALDTEGVPTARVGKWSASTIQRVLDSVALDAEVAAAANIQRRPIPV